MIEEDGEEVADEEDLVVTEEVVEEAVAASAEDVVALATEVAVEVVEVDLVTEADVEADEALRVAEGAVRLEVEDEAVLEVARRVVLEVDPTSLSSHTVIPVSLSPKARRCCLSQRTLPLASLSTAKSAFRSRRLELVLMEQAQRPNTVSGTLSDQSSQPVFSAV